MADLNLASLAAIVAGIPKERLDSLKERAKATGIDFYSLAAAEVLGLSQFDGHLSVTPEQRSAAKEGYFMHMYGSTPEQIKNILNRRQ